MDAEVFHSLKNLTLGVPPLTELFRTGPSRSQWLTVDACGIHADFSRQRINKTLYEALVHSASVIDVQGSFRKMMSGDIMNATEERAVGHMALRASAKSSPMAQQASGQLGRAKVLADGVRSGAISGATGKQFATVINIGIGGSDLGPGMVTRALRRFANGPVVKFVSNIDAADLDEALLGAVPETTLFIISSKTFTTLETMHNAERARRWVQASVEDWSQHFVAATSDAEAALNWGIQKDCCLEFFDWVGGRFSVSSVIGFPVMCAIGGDQFSEFLAGMSEMDHHVVTESSETNLPVMHALMWWMNSALHSFPTVAVIPYSHDLSRLPAYLQQLVMESNGKSVGADGRSVLGGTSPVVWGESGTNGQHAFFQMLHQGTQVVPVEFVTAAASLGADDEAHDLLFANVIAQSEALAAGRTHIEPHKSFEGNRPSSVLVLDELGPRHLGSLIAMYEHSATIQGWLMGVNSFDQWGVELGKILAVNAANAIASGVSQDEQTMTHPLLNWYLSIRKNCHATNNKGDNLPPMASASSKPIINSAERMLNLVALLTESNRPLTLEDIGNYMEHQYPVKAEARRTAFERDKKSLRKLGVPITTQVLGGNDAGKTAYSIDRAEYKLINFDLTEDELSALQQAAALVQIDTQWGKQAVQWLGGDIDESPSRTVAHVDARSQELPQLWSAIAKNCQISFPYHGRVRTVHPFGLISRNGFWYLIAFDTDRETQVTYRVDRFEDAATIGAPESFTRPSDFNLATAFERDAKAFSSEDTELARVRLDRRIAPGVVRELGDDAIVASRSDGSVDVEVACGNRVAFRSWLYAMVDRAEVISPESLRNEIMADLARLAGGPS